VSAHRIRPLERRENLLEMLDDVREEIKTAARDLERQKSNLRKLRAYEGKLIKRINRIPAP
jgi:hypothetical protein